MSDEADVLEPKEIRVEEPQVSLPPIPAKRYFTISEASVLCGVKSHVLRFWEQKFPQLHPSKRRGNRRYYQYHDLVLIREIRHLLYERGFTLNGALAQITVMSADKSHNVVELKKQLHKIIVSLEETLAQIHE